MKVPIVDEDNKNEAVEPDAVETAEDAAEACEAAEEAAADAEPCAGETDDEADERARVEAAIKAGEERAERELASDAGKLREERDELQKKLSEAEDAVASAEKSAADAADRLMRLQADWDNYRRRTAAERLAEKERAAEKLVCGLLPVLDDMERAIEHARGAAGADAGEGSAAMTQFVDGVEAVYNKMLDVLAKEGVEPMNPVGEPFEPLSHQAVGRVEDAEAYDETVAQVYQKGYRMGGKVIRNAMVTVTYGGPKRPAEDAEDAAK